MSNRRERDGPNATRWQVVERSERRGWENKEEKNKRKTGQTNTMGQFIHPSSHLLPPLPFFFHITKFVGGVDKTGKRVIAVLSGNRVKALIFLQFPSTESKRTNVPSKPAACTDWIRHHRRICQVKHQNVC